MTNMTFINIIHQKIVLQLLIHAPLSSGSASTPAIWCSCLSETLDEEVDEGYEEERLAEEEHEGAYAVFLLCSSMESRGWVSVEGLRHRY